MWRSKRGDGNQSRSEGLPGLRGEAMKTPRRSGRVSTRPGMLLVSLLALLASVLAVSTAAAILPPPILPIIVPGDPDDPDIPYNARPGAVIERPDGSADDARAVMDSDPLGTTTDATASGPYVTLLRDHRVLSGMLTLYRVFVLTPR
jgi:hypothetical protein